MKKLCYESVMPITNYEILGTIDNHITSIGAQNIALLVWGKDPSDGTGTCFVTVDITLRGRHTVLEIRDRNGAIMAKLAIDNLAGGSEKKRAAVDEIIGKFFTQDHHVRGKVIDKLHCTYCGMDFKPRGTNSKCPRGPHATGIVIPCHRYTYPTPLQG